MASDIRRRAKIVMGPIGVEGSRFEMTHEWERRQRSEQ